jgi:hypothetical protein
MIWAEEETYFFEDWRMPCWVKKIEESEVEE